MTPDGASPNGIGRAQRLAAACLAALFCAGGGVATAANGGGTGASLPDPPKLTRLSCVERCASQTSAIPGSQVALAGKGLGEVATIDFAGEGGAVAAEPDELTANRILATVPQGAVTGKVRVTDRFGQDARSPNRLKIVDESHIPAQDASGSADITVTPPTAFFDSQEPITVTYLYTGATAGDARLELVDRTTGEVVGTWTQAGAQPGSYMTFQWDGVLADEQAAPSGEYSFRVGPASGQTEGGGAASAISVYDHVFPIRGRHKYGDGVGAARKGHSHQGQDVFAACGTPLVAARGGRVQYAGYHGAAGNYLVIDARGSGRDYAYMHLTERVAFSEGDRVYTGQQIGTVGDSGNASGCHLHFEIWSAPGWYEGGEHLRSVTRELKNWDSWS